ncbi:MAG: phosphoribosylformylglycinamidine synthase subunit PurQ [Candidatus Nitrosocaldaceae archaeon]|nr:MAG: phosphoribosylformylglycinamidine synthase subunit PurQ [Candidatus Nitrosocaldaceae archaeon]
MRIAVIVFPGSNCDKDVYHVLKNVLKVDASLVWHTHEELRNFDAIILPGGFAYGDRLRAGIIAAFSPVMKSIKALAKDGIPILGVCNGFQILVEAGLLPGALIKNESLKFVCKWSKLIVENNKTPFTIGLRLKQELDIPVANQEGRYYVSEDELKDMIKDNQIVFRYKDNPTGALDSIAGVCNKDYNVVGMMPHPERASECILSPYNSNDGLLIFKSLLSYLEVKQWA